MAVKKDTGKATPTPKATGGKAGKASSKSKKEIEDEDDDIEDDDAPAPKGKVAAIFIKKLFAHGPAHYLHRKPVHP